MICQWVIQWKIKKLFWDGKLRNVGCDMFNPAVGMSLFLTPVGKWHTIGH